MLLYNEKQTEKMFTRPVRTMDIVIEEKPERKKYIFSSERQRQKFIKSCETECRSSKEYKDMIAFMKKNINYKKCVVLQGLKITDGKKYSIEIHHHPFTLFDICHIVMRKREAMSEKITPKAIADEVMKLHYDGLIGLIPLTVTCHELYHDGQIFIPLQYVYQDYSEFVDKYDIWIPSMTEEKVNIMYEMSKRSEHILSDVLEPEFTYINIDGFNFPNVPEEWGNMIKAVDYENMKFEDKKEEKEKD